MPGIRLRAIAAVLALAFTSAPASSTEVETAAVASQGSVRIGEAPTDPVVAAGGDIACGVGSSGAACVEMKTSDLLAQINPAAVLPLGDVQYEQGEYEYFLNGKGPGTGTGYNPTWGRLKSVTRPAVGNHEYGTPGAAGYFDYFNGIGNPTGMAGDRDKGYYSFDIGNWHLVALNSNCSKAGGCSAGTPQEKWLRADLAAHPKSCQIAYWHHARWASDKGGSSYDSPHMQAMFQALYDYGVELLLVGHSHFYERFAPQDPSQKLDRARGVRQIITGTGGRNVYDFQGATIEPNSEVRDGSTFGVLKVTLHGASYDWEFVPIAGQTFTDSGTDVCHRTTADTTAPTAPELTGPGLARAFQAGTRFRVAWGGATDNDSGVASYSVSVRRAPFTGDFQPPTPFQTGVTEGSAMFTGEPGFTYCFQATATDWSGNASPASEECTAVPVDNTSFKHRGGWKMKRAGGHFLDTFSETKSRGATLTLKGVKGQDLGIMVTRCPRCGAIHVFFRGRLVGRIDLRSESTRKLQVVDLKASGGLRTGTVRVKVVSARKLVRVDGLGVSSA